MCRVPALGCLFGILLFNSVQGNQLCKFSDEECLKNAAVKAYNTFKYGWKNVIAPLDPLYLEEKIYGNFTNVAYELSDLSLKGLGQCEIVSLKFEESELKYDYRLHCPHLVFSYYEKIKGYFLDQELDEEGPCVITADDYILIFKGKVEQFITDDKLPRYTFKNYTVETEPKGKLFFDNDNIIKGDKATAHFLKTFINSHWKDLEHYLRSPILESFLKVFIKAHDTFVKTVPFDDSYWNGDII